MAPRRLPIDPEPLAEPAQYVDPVQLAEGPEQPRYNLRGNEPEEEGLLPFPLPPIPGPDIEPPRERLREEMPDIIAGRMTPEQRLAAEYLKEFEEPRGTVGKTGTADEGLDFYSKVPGEVRFINGEPWLYDETNQEEPWRRYTANHAYDPKTGQVYESKAAGQPHAPLAGSLAEIPQRAGEVAVGAVADPITAFGRYMERARLGLVAPSFVDIQDASAIAGGMAGGDILRRTTRPGPAAPTPEPAAPPRPLPQPAPDIIPIPEPTPQYRVRPGGVWPQRSLSTEEVAAAARARRRAAERPETDEAGFYINALERGKRELPEQATAQEMREALVEMDVSAAEAAMLGLDRMLMGDAAVAQAQLREVEQEVSRAASRYNRARTLSQRMPENTGYQEQAAQMRREFEEARSRLPEARQTAQSAERTHIQDALTSFRNAEAQLKKINENIRAIRQQQGNDYGTLFEERKQAREYLNQTRRELEQARASDPRYRVVTREQVLEHIRANRPRTDLEIREYPKERYGPMTEPIARIREGMDQATPPLQRALMDRGIEAETAHNIASGMARAEPTEWGQIATALSENRGQVGLILDALEAAAGAPLNRMVDAWRGTDPFARGNRPPQYRSAIPDKNNSTLQEIAVTLKGPWEARRSIQKEIDAATENVNRLFDEYSRQPKGTQAEADALARYEQAVKDRDALSDKRRGAPKPPFQAAHWDQDIAPIGHMQVTMQRAPGEISTHMQGVATRIADRLQVINRRMGEINDRMIASDLTDGEYGILRREERALERERDKLEERMPVSAPSDDTIYMGNQFQSDWAGRGMEGFQSSADGQRLDALTRRMQVIRDQQTALNQRLDEMSVRNSRNAGTQMAHMTQGEREAFRRNSSGIRDGIRQELDILANELHELDAQRHRIQASPAYHALVANTRAWLRPVLEQFIDRGIASGAKYLGVPDGITVKTHNVIGEGTLRFYGEILRDELKFVMQRRGLPYSERQINSMHHPTRDEQFTGIWYIIEIPRNAKSGKGVRLMVKGIPVPQPDEENE